MSTIFDRLGFTPEEFKSEAENLGIPVKTLAEICFNLSSSEETNG